MVRGIPSLNTRTCVYTWRYEDIYKFLKIFHVFTTTSIVLGTRWENMWKNTASNERNGGINCQTFCNPYVINKVTDRILFRYQNHRNDVNVNLRLYIETQHTCKIQINRDQQAQCYQDHFSVDNKFPVCSHMRIVVFLYICDEVQRIFIHDGRILSNCAV